MALRQTVDAILSVVFIVGLTFAEASSAPSAIFNAPTVRRIPNKSACPARCSSTGPFSGNWSVYHSIAQVESCDETVFYDFALVDRVDDASINHRIYACTSFGQDWTNLPATVKHRATSSAGVTTNVTYSIGYWNGTSGASNVAGSKAITPQLRQFLLNGFAPTKGPAILLASAGVSSFGLYVGEGLQNQAAGRFALQAFENVLSSVESYNAASLAMQYCPSGQTADHVFGFIAVGDKSFVKVQDALTSWSSGVCLPLPKSENFTGLATFTTPLLTQIPTRSNFTSTSAANAISGVWHKSGATTGSKPISSGGSILNPNSVLHSSIIPIKSFHSIPVVTPSRITPTRSHIEQTLQSPLVSRSSNTLHTTNVSRNSSIVSVSKPAMKEINPRRNVHEITPRADCSTIQVVAGDGCASLAQKCGISGADFTSYNPGSNFCASLQPSQHVCCSAGSLPNFAPKPNADGSCASYTVQSNDNCANIAIKYSLTVDQLGKLNVNTWGWNGCSNIWLGTIICISPGNPPMPAALAGTTCGPQVPGTQRPPPGTDISSLNPCPLNACCDIWGQCGNTPDFCTDTRTGAPGTAAPGTNGCISNCGTDIVRSEPPAALRKIAFFQGYNLGRDCLYQTAAQIDASAYTHLFFSFGTLTDDFQVEVGDDLSNFEFREFMRTEGPIKILSIGGWSFSTDPSTYHIFRNGVTPGNRRAMASQIAQFINTNDLDGVNIDWEYPGAQDIPGIPPASLDDGENYLAFLAELRYQLPTKEISIAAPASYWYLKAFPIGSMSKVLDYIVYMTYDLHGQWDANNQWSQLGCTSGTCLRTDVNLTETMGALVMITKAGVPSNQVVVGVTSYGRSFAMAEAGCYGPQCTYLGSATDSMATPGVCTNTAGYIANAEIQQIANDPSRVNYHFVDKDSHSNILVYDQTQWVGWMDDAVKAQRAAVYQGLAMSGTADWATDLQRYNAPPETSSSWNQFKFVIKSGGNPASPQPLEGNWTSLTCKDHSVTGILDLTPAERWSQMGCEEAWRDLTQRWRSYHDDQKGTFKFSEYISALIYGPNKANCGEIGSNNCDQTLQCNGFIAPAAYEIWNSVVMVNEIYSNYHSALVEAAATSIDNSLAVFEKTFAPVPPPKDNSGVDLIISIVTLGVSALCAPMFNIVLKELPYFVSKANQLGVIKDETSALVTFGTAVARNQNGKSGIQPWSADSQQSFSMYLGQALDGWSNNIIQTLRTLFDGSPDSISTLYTLVQHGQLISGKSGEPSATIDGSKLDTLKSSVARTFYAFAIPALWQAAHKAAFILDSGYPCGTKDPMGDHMTPDDMHISYGCYGGNLYYLVTPFHPDVLFVPHEYLLFAVDGVSSFDGTMWGGMTTQLLIEGSVRTYIANGNQNNGLAADPGNSETIADLMNQDVATPGLIRLPVCSFTRFSMALDFYGPNANHPDDFPCTVLRNSYCHDFSYFDPGTVGTPPLISDCQDLVSHIIGTNGQWTTTLGIDREIVRSGSCHLSVQNNGAQGDAWYLVGAQDVVDIINESIKRYGSNGRVGAKGSMWCTGDVNANGVHWWLY